MANVRKLAVQFTGDASGASRAFRQVSGDADRTESKLGRWAKGIAGAFAAAFAIDTVVSWGTSLISAAEDAQKVGRQTEAVITSMGASSWTTAEAIGDLAEKISLKTGLDDEMIQSGENVLLTFRNVRNEIGRGNDIFTRATTVATDMSVALGQDLQSSVTQIGKALNDPIAGISALTRVGVQFTQQQKDQIATLVESGDTLGAQKLILAELEAQFTGSAEAQATASGRMKVAWDNLIETLGTYLLPLFTAVTDWLINSAIPWFDNLATKVNETVVPALRSLWQWIQVNVLPVLSQLWDQIVAEIVPALQSFGNWIRTSVVPNLKAIWEVTSAELIPALRSMWRTLSSELMPALRDLAGSLAQLFGRETETKGGADDLRDSWHWLGVVIRVGAAQFNFAMRVLAALVRQLNAVVGAADAAADAIKRFWDSKSTAANVGWSIASPVANIFRKRAVGGPMTAGQPYWVGEKGPELVFPNRSGFVATANESAAMAAGGGWGGGRSVNVYLDMTVQGSVHSERDLISAINRAADRGIKIAAGAVR